ncbi:MAG: TRAP transporter substrate-binding protein DctP [Sneathiella sp.]
MKRILKTATGALAGIFAMTAFVSAEEWRFNNPLPETRPESAELNTFADEVNAALGDDFKLKMFGGGSLGLKNADALRFLPRESVEMSLIWANYLGRDAPALSSVFVQGSVGTVDELKKVLPVVREIYEEEFAKWDVTAVGYVAIPMLSVSVFCRDEPVRTLAALKTKKLRVWARDQVETFTRLGVSAQIIPQEDMYIAMKTGVVDCALYPALYAHTVSLQEVAKHASFLYPMASGPYVLGVSTKRWGKTDDKIKSALTSAAQAVWDRTNQYEDDFQRELAARDNMVKAGVNWLDDFPKEDRALFIEAVNESWKILAEEAGGRAPGYRQRVLTALGR